MTEHANSLPKIGVTRPKKRSEPYWLYAIAIVVLVVLAHTMAFYDELNAPAVGSSSCVYRGR